MKFLKMVFSYKICRTLDDVYELISYVQQTGYASIDFETSSLEYYEDTEYPTTLSISFQPGSGWVIPLGHFESPFRENYEQALKILKPTIEDPNIVKVAWNAKYEYKWLRRFNIEPMGRFFDAMLLKYLLKEDRPHGLKEMTALMLPDFAGYELPGSNRENFNWAGVPLEELAKYNAKDTDNTLRIFLTLEAKVIKNGFYPLFRNLFSMLVRVLGKCEYFGMQVDLNYLNTMVKKYQELMTENEKAIRELKPIRRYQRRKTKAIIRSMVNKLEEEIEDLEGSGKDHLIRTRLSKIANIKAGIFSTKKERELVAPMNFGSSPQMTDFLYLSNYGLELPILEYTDSGKPSTSEDTLLKLKEHDDSGFIDRLLKYRELSKLNSTYIEGMLKVLSSQKRIHTSYKINGTVTGRISSTSPNMQNIPRTCISRDQVILTKEGLIPIGSYIPKKPGVYPIDGPLVKTHTGKWQKITHAVNKGKEEMFKVTLTDGSSIVCTMGHQLLTIQGFKSLKEILHNNLTILAHD